MATEKTPLLVKPRDEVVVKIPKEKLMDYDINHNNITTSLTYEELLPFIIDPSWMRLRKICFTSCWIIFFVILLAACISSYMSMSKMACGVSALTESKSDNATVELGNAMGEDGGKGILSIVLSSINATVTT